MAEIELRDVTKIYTRGEAPAVRDLSLRIPDGQFVVVLGPSGCGKSTTLRLIAGLEKANAGEIRIGGELVDGVPPQERDTAFVFQNYALYPHMTVARNIGFPLKMRKVPVAEIRKRIEEVGWTLGLERLLERYPGQLSGGERQRVALGRAIVRQPAAFLLDEPLSNLDAQLRAEVRVELAQLQRQLEATFVFVTHDQVEAMTLADLMAVIREGVLQQTGTPEEIYRYPANRFVASFIGSPRMNFIDATIVSRNGTTVIEAGDVSWPLGSLAVPDNLPDGRVVVGIRPEHFKVSASGSLGMSVELVEPLGSQTFIYGKVGNGLPLTVGVDPVDHPQTGEYVQLFADEEHVHFFHPETGDRINGL